MKSYSMRLHELKVGIGGKLFSNGSVCRGAVSQLEQTLAGQGHGGQLLPLPDCAASVPLGLGTSTLRWSLAT